MSDHVRTKIYQRRKMLIFSLGAILLMIGLVSRLVYLMVFCQEHYVSEALDVQQRERSIKAARGEIFDANGVLLATNRTVCTVSVVHNQIEDEDAVTQLLVKELELDEETVREKVQKKSSREVIMTNVDKAVGDVIRSQNLSGIKVDEDYKRYYPYGSLASKVLGFTGGDNQGIIGIEVLYEEYLKGTDGKILTPTDAKGIELNTEAEQRVEPIPGDQLYLTLDVNIQQYAQQAATQLIEKKMANQVSVIAMNPQNGEVLAMVNIPEFDLNDPYTLTEELQSGAESEKKVDLLNQMWRNGCINDTYEPGSTFKIITMTAGLAEGVVSVNDTFFCPGYKIVEDRKIRCHKTAGHGSETFVEGAMNSCNPVFMEVGQRIGASTFYDYFQQFGLLEKTGIDLPGEASTIMHSKDAIGEVELATMSFGQSFQLTPIRLLTTVCSIINGGHKVTPHLAKEVRSADESNIISLSKEQGEEIISEEVSKTVREILEKVVSEGGGKNAQVEGFSIGGKTATSEKLPRGTGKYISSFLGFSSTDNPQIAILITVDEPEGVYYGGTVCAPVVAEIFENILPYLFSDN